MNEDYVLCFNRDADELNIIIDVKINMAFSLSLGPFFLFISIMMTEKRKTNYIKKILRYVFHSH